MNLNTRWLVFLAMFAFIGYSLYSAGSQKHDAGKVYSKKVIYLNTEAKLKQVTSQNKLVVVDFYADWCPPCKQLAPHIGKLADSHDGKVKVVKVNVDDAGELAKAYKIQSIPTLFVIKDGKVVSQEGGYKSYEELVKWVEKHEDVKS